MFLTLFWSLNFLQKYMSKYIWSKKDKELDGVYAHTGMDFYCYIDEL